MAFAADIVSENALAVMTVGQKNELSFLIKNISSAEWPCVSGPDNNHAVSFQTRWTPETGIDGATVDVEKELPYDVEPGDTVGLTLSVTAPSKPGRYYLEADLVQKGVARFRERGSTAFKRAVEIVP